MISLLLCILQIGLALLKAKFSSEKEAKEERAHFLEAQRVLQSYALQQERRMRFNMPSSAEMNEMQDRIDSEKSLNDKTNNNG